MGIVRVTLFDFDPKTGTPKEPIVAQVEYDPDMTLEDQGCKKVSITAGDDVGCGTVLLPLQMLSSAMTAVLDADTKRNSSIIMPDHKIIRPN